MNGNLSHGVPPLATSGNRIVRADTMNPVLLRGVNRSGMEYSEPGPDGFLAAAQFTQDEVREIVQGWRANAIRLPFNQDWCLAGRNGHAAEEYLSSLDQVISWAAELGAYTILDLQWLDADTAYGTTAGANGVKNTNHVAPLPDEKTIELWPILGTRYKDEPAVLFDLFNEPHDPLEDDFEPLHLIADDGEIVESQDSFITAGEWVSWATRLTGEIRDAGANGIVLVGGIDWAFDLSEIQVDGPNIVYSAHIYPNRKQSDWPNALGAYADVPIFVGEWGGGDQDLEFGRALADVMRSRGLGWTAWSWVDYPQLIVPPRAPDYRPTTFGALVKGELQT